MTVRAKVRCASVTEHAPYADGRPHWSAEFWFASGNESEENKKFWDASPSGKLELHYINENLYVAGAWYYLDWTPTTLKGTGLDAAIPASARAS